MKQLTLKEFRKQGYGNQYNGSLHFFLKKLFTWFWPKVIVSVTVDRALEIQEELNKGIRLPMENEDEIGNLTMFVPVSRELQLWAKKNIKGRYRCNNGFWWEFERKQDAAIFLLFWS